MIEKYFYLTDSTDLLAKQLLGEELNLTESLNLAQNISTDAIFPTRGATSDYTQYGNFALSNFNQIKEGDLMRIKPEVLVVGNGFGTGSSREHAPISLKQVGVKKIICMGGRVERIFLENSIMAGIEVYEHPHDIETRAELEEALKNDEIEQAYRDKLRPDIAQVGGISAYNRMRIEHRVEPIAIRHNEVDHDYPMTASEKILAEKMTNVLANIHNKRIVRPGDTGFVSLNYRMSYELHAIINRSVLENELQGLGVVDPETVHFFQDHSALQVIIDPKFAKLMEVQRNIAINNGFKLHTPSSDEQLTDGICHTLSVEQTLVRPGEVGIGTDSHMCSLGVLNALTWGIGATHFANTLVTNEALVEVPKSVKINLQGKFNANVTPKDLMLYILSQDFVKGGSSTNTVFEYDGEGLDGMTLGDQFVLTNMAVEGRAMTGIITRLTPALNDHLTKTTTMTVEEIGDNFVSSDPDADFYKNLNINLQNIEPMVALPGDPRNGIPLSKLPEIEVKNVYIGSCTGGNLEDLRMVASVLKDKKIATHVKLRIQAASLNISNQAKKLGYFEIFKEAGAEVVGLGCGACIGLGPGRVQNITKDEKSDSVTISDTNRNFPGRMGGDAPVYLTSPITAAIAAVNGFIGDKKTN